MAPVPRQISLKASSRCLLPRARRRSPRANTTSVVKMAVMEAPRTMWSLIRWPRLSSRGLVQMTGFPIQCNIPVAEMGPRSVPELRETHELFSYESR